MGKLMNGLNAQLKTEHKEDAKKCIVIYEHLRDTNDGRVWESQWRPLVNTLWDGVYPAVKMVCKPTNLGLLLLESLERKAVGEVEQTHNKLREILRSYNNPEWGDCIVDDICRVFGYPTTIDGNTEEEDAVDCSSWTTDELFDYATENGLIPENCTFEQWMNDRIDLFGIVQEHLDNN